MTSPPCCQCQSQGRAVGRELATIQHAIIHPNRTSWKGEFDRGTIRLRIGEHPSSDRCISENIPELLRCQVNEALNRGCREFGIPHDLGWEFPSLEPALLRLERTA